MLKSCLLIVAEEIRGRIKGPANKSNSKKDEGRTKEDESAYAKAKTMLDESSVQRRKYKGAAR